MLLDRKHKWWFLVTLALSAAAVGVYLIDVQQHPVGKWGSTPLGITMGVLALGLMAFCCGLGLKRRVPHWRTGRAQTWMRGHIWLGLLVVVLTAAHGAFRLGGALTTLLWALLGAVTISGLLGLVLQQYLPSLLLHSVPGETVAQMLDRELAALVDRAREIVEAHKDCPPMQDFFAEHMEPYLRGAPNHRLERGEQTEVLFQSLIMMTEPRMHEHVRELESVCSRRRQLLNQRMIMRVLTIWLIVHVPLSWLLLLLAIVHGVVALRYG